MHASPASRSPEGQQFGGTAAPPSQRPQPRYGLLVGDRQPLTLAGLAGVVEHRLRIANRDLVGKERRQAVMPVISCVSVRAHAEEADIEKPQREPQDLAMGELRIVGQGASDLDAQLRLDPAERLHVGELQLVAVVAPGWVVSILLSPASVDAGRL